MKLKILACILALYLILVQACASLKPEKYILGQELKSEVPCLEIIIDDWSIRDQYGFWCSQDADLLFRETFNTANCPNPDSIQGYAVWRTSAAKIHVDWGWMVPSLMTLFIINLFGFPVRAQTSDVIVELEILDRNKRLITSYVSRHSGKAYSAMYWGYYWQGTKTPIAETITFRASRVKALSQCIIDIMRQVMDDLPEIKRRLYKI